ncbi:MAG: response regulator [Desulfovibrio sp.]|jgi:two-component system response regulator ResD|nr:response regulator [Desulfovibrio sp.]
MSAPARIMIIDDEERIRQLLLDFLEDYDDEFGLRSCESAEEALLELEREQADLCIVDMRLPGMDGQAFILRAHERGLCRRFVLHTGSMDFSLNRELEAIGLEEADIFFKPCDMEQMLARIRHRLNSNGARP